MKKTCHILLAIGIAIVPACSSAKTSVNGVDSGQYIAHEADDKWLNAEVLKGDWIYSRDADGSFSRFERQGRTPNVVIRCDQRNKVVMIAHKGGNAQTTSLDIATNEGTRRYRAAMVKLRDDYSIARLSANDQWLDKIAYSRGYFAIYTQKGKVLAVPNWSEVGSVIEDCRAGG